jgi:hypothetical protein
MKPEYGYSKFKWIGWILVAVVLFAVWFGLNSAGYHISPLDLLAVMVFCLVGSAIVSALGRAGVPAGIIRLIVLAGVAIFGCIAINLGLFSP